MNVNVEDLGKLKRKLSVEIPLSEVQSTYDEVFSRIRTNVQIKGFRKGKFPRQLAEKRFKSLMEQEATRNLVPKYFDMALKEEKLRPATEPNFDNLDVNKDKPLSFDVEFEVVPDFDIPEPSEFKLEQKSIRILAKDLDEQIETLRKSRATPNDKGDAPAEEGDVLTFDYHGTIDGEPFAGGSATDQRNEIGSSNLLPEFDKNLIGMKAGEDKSFDITFPDDYGAEDLQGKAATFAVSVKTVESMELPKLNKEFYSQFGEVTTKEAFRKKIKEQMTAEKERAQFQELQQSLADKLKKKLKFDVPEQLVTTNVAEFEHQLEHRDPEALKDEKKLAKLKKDEEKSIKDNLRLQFVLDAVADRDNIRAAQEEVQQRFTMQAYMMQQNPAELINTPYGQRMVDQIHREMTYTKVLEHLVNLVLGKVAEPQDAEASGGEGADAPAAGPDSAESGKAEADASSS